MKKPDGYNGYEGGAPYWIGPSDRKFYDYHEYKLEVKEYEESLRKQHEQEKIREKLLQDKLKNCISEIVERTIPHKAGDNIYDQLKKQKYIIYKDKDTHQKIYEKAI